MPLLPDSETNAKIDKYQNFAEQKLKPQLEEYNKARDTVYQELGQYLQLRNTIEMFREQKLKTFETRVDMGKEFYIQAEASDLERFVVKVSQHYYVELNQDEALLFIKKKETLMNSQIEQLSQKAAEVKAHIVFVNEAIRELLNISEERTKKER